MSSKLNHQQTELFKAVDEVLQYIWDPIGVAGVPSTRNEYETYVHRVFSMIINKGTADEIVNYLVGVEAKSMGLERNRKRAKEVAAILCEHRNTIFAGSAV
ncbi:MAG: hypothetical protein AAF756_01210 [Pseudomonadota bacterium]